MQREELNELNSFKYYMRNALKFYTLKSDALTKLCFLLLLGTFSAAFFIPFDKGKNVVYICFFSAFSLVTIALSLYLTATIRELRKKEYTISYCIKRVNKKFFTIIFGSLLYYGGMVLGTLLLIIPGFIIASVYILGLPYILDLGENTKDSFEASKRMIKKYGRKLFDYVISFFLSIIAGGYFLLTLVAASGSVYVILFTFAFEISLAILMFQRFIAFIYIDIEYGNTNQR